MRRGPMLCRMLNPRRLERLASCARRPAARPSHGGKQVLVVERRTGSRRASRVMTTTCPRVAGLMSITVIVRSSESTSSRRDAPPQGPCRRCSSAPGRPRAQGYRRASVVYAAAPRMPVDNQLYDRLADTWWNDDSVLSLLRTSINPARFGYMRRVLVEELGIDPRGKTALDVGSGGGLLAEEFARLGFRVTGIDPSARVRRGCPRARRVRGPRDRVHGRRRRAAPVRGRAPSTSRTAATCWSTSTTSTAFWRRRHAS